MISQKWETGVWQSGPLQNALNGFTVAKSLVRLTLHVSYVNIYDPSRAARRN